MDMHPLQSLRDAREYLPEIERVSARDIDTIRGLDGFQTITGYTGTIVLEMERGLYPPT